MNARKSTTRLHLSSASVALAGALLAGCTMMPAYERPAAAVPADWPASSTRPKVVAPAAASLEWQSFYSDPQLRELIAVALQNNRDLRIAALNIEQSRAQYQIRRADQYPGVALAAAGSRTPNTSGGITSVYTAGLSATAYEIDFFGRVSSLKEAALAQFLATAEARKTAQISLVSSVAASYMGIVADEELLAITRQTLATREESLRLMRLRVDNGASSDLDLRLAESLVEAARVTLAQLQRQRATDENALVLLLGQTVPATVASGLATASLAQLPVLADVPEGLPSDLLTNRPDVRQAEQVLVSANANIGAARAAFFPRITLTAGLGSASKDLSGLFQSGSFGWTFAPQVSLPIFDAGRNEAGLASANVGRDIALAQYDKAVQTAFREVADALAGRATLDEQLRAQQAQAQAESARYQLSELRFRHGVASSLELLDAQRALFAARQAVTQTRLAQLQSRVTLYKALGGGWGSDTGPAGNQAAR